MAFTLQTAVLFLLCSSAFAQFRCPSGDWHLYNGRCYQARDQDGSMTWYDAEDMCEKMGGTLAVVDSIDVNNFLASISDLTDNHWIGLHDIGTEGTFVWVDGTTYDASQSNWDAGQPDNYNDVEDCVHIKSNQKWNDQSCSNTLPGYFCQHVADVPIKCDEDNGWSSVNDMCYKYMDTWATFSGAQAYCQKMDANLVTIENQYVQDYVVGVSELYQTEMWIGASDTISATTGSFTWIDGSALSYTNWAVGEPKSGYSSNCAQIVYGNNGEWTTQDCESMQRHFVCAKMEGTCESGWLINKGSCYQFNTFTPATWTDAKHTCDIQGGHLITINNQEENAYLMTQFEYLRSAGISDIWIGLSDKNTDGNFVWADGSNANPSYTNWNSGEPRNVPSQDDCASIYVDSSTGAWDVLGCYILQAFICEIPVGQPVIPIDPGKVIGSCPDAWTLNDQHCYYFETNQMSFANAELACEGYGATLASIGSGDEQSFLSGRAATVNAWLWIGLHDRRNESGWEWVDGSQYGTFLNWAPDEPNDYGSGEDCVHMDTERSRVGEWNDRACDAWLGFVCKKPKSYDGTFQTEAPKAEPVADPRCGVGYEIDSSTNTCYMFATDVAVDWPTAEVACHLNGGHLLSIKNQAEQTFVNARMYGLTSSVLWIGANDRTDEGGWEWCDGTPFAYLNWGPGEPNDYDHGTSGEDCTEIVVSTGQWNDHRCDQTIGYICKNQGDIVDYFNVYRGYVLDGFDQLRIDNVYADECAKRCLEETSFICYSFDYDRINMACELSSYTKETAGIALRSDANFDHYQVVTLKQPEVPTTLAPNSRCEYGWYSYGSYCYFLQTVSMTWNDARDVCRRDGADLVSIKDINENSFVLSLVQKMCDSFHTDSTSDMYDYRFVSSPVSSSRLNFDVKAASDVHIALTENNYAADPLYEIVIGGWSNTQSGIRRCAMCGLEVSADTVDILSDSEFRSFWIMFDNGKISVGRDGEVAFMEWQDPNPLPVNYVGYTTGYGSSGDFILCTQNSDDSLIWTGMNDLRTQMTFEWSDLTEVTFTRWNNGEPNNFEGRDEDCVNMFIEGNSAGYWNDERCFYSHKSVCKKPKQVLPASTPSSGDCGVGWYTQGHSCYRFLSDQITWNKAEQQCNTMGANLVAINDNVEQAYITSKLGLFGDGGTWYWLGLTDLSSPGQFTWSDGDPVTYTHWDDSQPDLYQGDCVQANTGSNAGLWSVTNCNHTRPYVCEKTRPGFTKPPVVIPYPTNPSNVGCADGWLGYGTSCFLAVSKVDVNERLSWADAQLDCKSRGGDLASFHSDDELRYVKTNSQVVNFIEEFWIGLNDRDEENGFVWTDGSPVNFVKWDEGEPNDSGAGEDCVEMTFAAPKGWNDRNCEREKNWVCKLPKGVAPPTSIVPATPTKSSSCGSDVDWVYSMGACYYFSDPDSDGRLSWTDSRDFCLSKAGDLTSIHSSVEQQFIYNQMRDKQLITSWIGLRMYSTSGSHAWSDGTPVDYINWDEGQPDDAYGSEKCVELLATDGEWNDLNCGDRHTFVCKKLSSDTQPKTAGPTTLPDGNCPPGFTEYKNKCYSFNGGEGTESLDWDSARAQCGTYGGDLASIHSQEIQSFLTSNLRDFKFSMWIGLSDTMTKKKYRWQDGSEVDYTNWAPGEPNGDRENQEHCVEMHFGGYGGQWNDANCANRLGYVCQTLKSQSFPMPTSTPNPCKAGYAYYWNGCYKMYSGSYTWQSAREICLQDEADLVSIEDIYEQSYIETYMFNAKRELWIGLNDIAQAGTYGWSDGSPVFYTKWGNGEPSVISGEGCVMIGTDGGWDDTKCSTMTGAMCKYYVGSKPTTPAPVSGTCNFGNATSWSEYHKYCYNMDGLRDPKSWAEAAYECDRIGGYVVTIDDADEQAYIENIIYENSLDIWLGLIRTDLGGFEWVDGSPLDYTNWNEGEPNNYDNIEDCAEMYFFTKNWNDVSCYNAAGYICKREKGYLRTMPPDGNPDKQSSGLSGGAITGIVLGVILAIVAAGAVIYLVFLRDGFPTLKKTSSDPSPSVGFDNSLYTTSPSISIDDKVKLGASDASA